MLGDLLLGDSLGFRRLHLRGCQHGDITRKYQRDAGAGRIASLVHQRRVCVRVAHLWIIHADLEVEFAGRTAHYKQVPFQHTIQGSENRIAGTIPAKMTDFQIELPSLLAIPTKDEIPVRVEMVWRPM